MPRGHVTLCGAVLLKPHIHQGEVAHLRNTNSYSLSIVYWRGIYAVLEGVVIVIAKVTF